ncbi:MAG TPA: P1 family peptidase [Thermomicrobiales bacterium]|nr:P1 family peptidase [Thermomicrobiales bacterium]
MPQTINETGPRQRLRDLGVTIGRMSTGTHNAITDVMGVRVGHTTLISGEGPLEVGKGPVRTGVTVVLPHEGDIGVEPLFAGSHVLNGNGEMTGLLWVKESGMLTSPIAITNTHSVGVVRDALIAYEAQHTRRLELAWSLPVVAETYDGSLNDINGMHVKPEHVWAALDDAASGPVAEGCVGGGTGMICHEFKGGIGTSSRVLADEEGGWTVGVLVQANYGARHLLRVDGVPVGQLIPYSAVPGLREERARIRQREPGDGSIIIIIATNAPLLPHQCERLAQRATIGLARVGGIGANSSGDIFLAFATGNRGLPGPEDKQSEITSCRMIANERMTPLFEACAEATEEAILNAMCMASTMVGIDGFTVHALPLHRVREICAT